MWPCARPWGVLAFWLDRGVDGFPVDAVPYRLRARRHLVQESPRDARAHSRIPPPDRPALSRAHAARRGVPDAGGSSCRTSATVRDGAGLPHWRSISLAGQLFLAMCREDRGPVVRTVTACRTSPRARSGRRSCATTTSFGRARERRRTDELFRAYAGDPRARLTRGIRRRIARRSWGIDDRRVLFLHAVLLALPGTPLPLLRRRTWITGRPFPARPRRRLPMPWTSADERTPGTSVERQWATRAFAARAHALAWCTRRDAPGAGTGAIAFLQPAETMLAFTRESSTARSCSRRTSAATCASSLECPRSRTSMLRDALDGSEARGRVRHDRVVARELRFQLAALALSAVRHARAWATLASAGQSSTPRRYSIREAGKASQAAELES